MTVLKTPGWEDYELLDTGDGYRLERFGKYTLVRPDPQIIWKPHLGKSEWLKADAVFEKTAGARLDRGQWNNRNNVPKKWLMQYDNLSFYAELSPFKHTGIFPEQVLHWEWMRKKIKIQSIRQTQDKKSNLKDTTSFGHPERLKGVEGSRPSQNKIPAQGRNDIKVLNLFAYTGIASLVCAAAGAEVTHVDASRPTVGWARENQAASKLANKPIRWILDDAAKFVQREINRGVRYDGILMDPPIYGHGPKGETWNFLTSFPQLMNLCRKVLSDKPLFLIVNAYAISASSIMLENVLADTTKGLGGIIESGELALEEKTGKRLLSTGIFARWSQK